MESGEQRRITFPSKSPAILSDTTGSHLTFYSMGRKLSLLLASPHLSACEVLPKKTKAPCQIKNTAQTWSVLSEKRGSEGRASPAPHLI